MKRTLEEMVTKPMEYVMTEKDFGILSDHITDLFRVVLPPGEESVRIRKATDIMVTLRDHLYGCVDIRPIDD